MPGAAQKKTVVCPAPRAVRANLDCCTGRAPPFFSAALVFIGAALAVVLFAYF
jgi:hypothetical protein